MKPLTDFSLAQHLSKFSQQNKLCKRLLQWSIMHLEDVFLHKIQLNIAHHVVGLLLAGLVAPGWCTVVSMSIAKAAAFDNKIIDGIMVRGEESSAGMFGLAGTRLALQQTDSQIGDHELLLSSWSIGIH